MSRLELVGFRGGRLAPLDLAIEGGECVTLSGPSGSGKTLLLRAVADLDPHDGEARVDGERQDQLSGPEWRRRVGFLPAESHWWYPRVGDHFNGPAEPLVAALGLPGEALDWEVERLSSGERQRLALARLLAGEPRVLLLDEATANLDPESTERVERLIDDYRVKTGAAVLWVSHDRGQRARVAGRSLVIDGERLREETPWN